MPVENEVKYVLQDPDGQLAAWLAQHPDAHAATIDQGYLADNVRLRRFTYADGTVAHVHSAKYRVGDGRQVEIEVGISEEDFCALWPACERSLRKRRYTLADGAVHWDVDFLLHPVTGAVYFVLAEAEMPEEMEAPAYLPEHIAAHLVYDAGRQKGYSSRRLSDPAYAAAVMKRLMKACRPGAPRVADYQAASRPLTIS